MTHDSHDRDTLTKPGTMNISIKSFFKPVGVTATTAKKSNVSEENDDDKEMT
jgi:hypothetical protein